MSASAVALTWGGVPKGMHGPDGVSTSVPHTEEGCGQTLPGAAGPPLSSPTAGWTQDLHSVHSEQPSRPSAVVLVAQGLPVLMPGDIG